MNILLKLQLSLLEHTDFQIHLIRFRSGHLKPHTGGFVKIHLKGLAGGNLVFIENIEDKIASGAGIAVHIVKNFLNIGQLPDMVQGIARAGHQVKLRLRTKGDHIRHFIGNSGIPLTGDLDHAGGKIHPRRLNAAVLQNFTQNSRAAA